MSDASPQPAGEPLFAGPIQGLRAWSVVWLEGEPWLGGTMTRGLWEPYGGATRAVCDPGVGRFGRWLGGRTHPAPDRHCRCGLYAFHPHSFPDEGSAVGMRPQVAGVVAAWGRVELHRGGFRAEYARSVALVASPRARPSTVEAVHRLADRYRAELLEVEDIRAHCRREGIGLGDPVVDSLVPAEVGTWAVAPA